jgi:predicted nuclease of predicted toxin-antitoxin system
VTIRFLIDAQLPPGLARRLIAQGHPADHVNRMGLGVASDIDLWKYAGHAGVTLITKDEDFVSLASRDQTGPQVVWIRLGNISNDTLWRAIEPQLDEIIQALAGGERIVEVI